MVTQKGRRKHKHFQWLTEGIGNPKLLHHLGLLEGMARGFDDGKWDAFYDRVNRVLPPYEPLPLFIQPGEEAEEEPKKLLPSGA